jgi:hypothetical protein
MICEADLTPMTLYILGEPSGRKVVALPRTTLTLFAADLAFTLASLAKRICRRRCLAHRSAFVR